MIFDTTYSLMQSCDYVGVVLGVKTMGWSM